MVRGARGDGRMDGGVIYYLLVLVSKLALWPEVARCNVLSAHSIARL